MDYSKEELESLTTLSDKYSPMLAAKAKKPVTFIMIKNELTKLLEKNREALQTNIVGRQVLISQKDEDGFLAAIGIDRTEMEDDIKNSPYFAKFNETGRFSLLPQFVFAFPYMLMAYEYKKLNKDQYARVCYMITFFKPYASRISLLFGKYPVNEDQMLYTIEHMTEKSDLKKLGTIFEVISKKSDASYDNYYGAKDNKYVLTDADLGTIYTSGIATRINNFLLDVSTKYRDNKGKYMAFEVNSSKFDDDEGESDIVDADIASDAAIRTDIVSKAMNKATMQPIDLKLIRAISKMCLSSDSQYYQNMLTQTITNIVENMHKDLPEFFTCMVNSFLFTQNSATGEKYSMADFRTMTFVAVMNKKVYNNPNTNDINILKVKELLNKMLEDYCDEYASALNTKKRLIRNAVFMYWVCFLQKAGRG